MMTAGVFVAAAAGGGLRRAEVVAGQWQVEGYLAAVRVNCLAVDPHHDGNLFAGTQGDGLLRSEDSGRSWAPSGLPGLTIKAVAASPAQEGLLFAGAKPAAIYRSDDYGRSWQELEGFRRVPGRWLWFSPAEAPGTAYVQGLALSPRDPDLLLAGIEFGAVLRSQDGGRTWSGHRRGALRDCHSLGFHTSNGDWIYEAGGTGGGAAFSQDSGATWRKHKAGLDRHYGWACAADPADPATWYISMSPGPGKAHGAAPAQAYIFRSRAGEPWEKLSGGLPQPLDHMPFALLVDPRYPGQLFAGLSNGEIWHTADQGDHWAQLPLNLGSFRDLVLM